MLVLAVLVLVLVGTLAVGMLVLVGTLAVGMLVARVQEKLYYPH